MACAGIDFGNKTSVVAIARRGGIDICANEVSNRATPSVVSFQGDERHIGESAASIAAQNHRNTITGIQRLLGVPRATPFADAEVKRQTCNVIAHPLTAACAASVAYTGAVAEGENDVPGLFSFEALTAMLLSNLMDTASAEYKAPVRDLVISVPVYFTHAQRKAILNAATIANVNVLRVFNEHAAIALSYGIFRTKELPDSTPIKVAFVDIGEASTTVSIAAFTNTKCEIKSVATDPSLGGRDLDDIILHKFAQHFKTTYSIDVLSKPKPTARLRKESEKIKKVLSTNPNAPLNIECLMDDIDVKGHITRDELEEIAAPLLQRVRTVCMKALVDAGLQEGETLAAAELVGGSTRVPAFKQIITEVFGIVGAPVRTTLNADECIARGCALMSAMLSPAFKVRDYALTDIATHALNADKVFSDGTPTETLTLVPKGNPLPCVKVMKFKSPGALTVNVRYDDASSFPTGGDQSHVCGYLLDAPNDVDAKVHAKVRVTASGTVEMASAHLIKEVEAEEEVVVKKETTTPTEAVGAAKANGSTSADADATMEEANVVPEPTSEPAPPTVPGAATDGIESIGASDKMDTDSDKAPAQEVKEVTITEKRIVKKKKTTDLAITPLEAGGCTMTPEMVMAATEKEAKMKAHDLYIKERSEAMNSLEAYVYDLRSRIDEYSGDLKDYGPSEVRDALRKDLDQMEEWIYSEEAEKSSKSVFVEKKNELVKRATPMLMRRREFDERPVRIRVLEAALDNYKHVAVSPLEEYAHIKPEEKNKLLNCVEDAAIWLKGERVKQETLPKHKDPTLTCDLLTKKLKEVEAVCEPIKNTPKPTPPKEEKKVQEKGKVDESRKSEEPGKAEEPGKVEEPGKAEVGTETKVEITSAGDGTMNGEKVEEDKPLKTAGDSEMKV